MADLQACHSSKNIERRVTAIAPVREYESLLYKPSAEAHSFCAGAMQATEEDYSFTPFIDSLGYFIHRTAKETSRFDDTGSAVAAS